MADYRIINPMRDTARLNRAMTTLVDTRRKLDGMEAQMASFEQHLQQLNMQGSLYISNLRFSWNGTQLTWAAGWLKDLKGGVIQVRGGYQALAAETTYWIAWNAAHKRMLFSKNPATLAGNSANRVICAVTTGTAGVADTTDSGPGTDEGGSGLGGYQAPSDR